MPHRLPDVIIIGAMKAGTTSLFQYLISHPDVARGRKKEPDFFTDNNWDKGLEWYKNLFPENDKLKCEASTDYTKYPNFGPVAQRMHSVIPDAKLIYVIRDPVARVMSQVHHVVVNRAKKTGDLKPANIDWALRGATYVSKYYFQISHFLEYYSHDKIKCLKFEDMVADPLACMHDVSDFLGIDGSYYTQKFNFRAHNTKSTSVVVMKYRRLYKMLFKANWHRLLPPIHRLLETPVPRPELSLEQRQAIWDELADDLHQLEAFFGHSLGYKRPA